MTPSRRGILYVTAVIVMIAPPLVWVLSRLPGVPRGTVIVPVARAETTPTTGTPIQSDQAAPADELLALAERDPLALTHRAGTFRARDPRLPLCAD